MMCSFLLVCLTTQAQNKDEQVKRIRQLYAEAKQKIAQNGKEGKAPTDITVTMENGEEVDPDFILDNHTDLTFYFDRKKSKADQEFYDQSDCYFIKRYWTSHGHENFQEILVDPVTRFPIFCYSKNITDGGYVQENRYYYDELGRTIHGIFKAGLYDEPLRERDDETLTPNIGDESLIEAKNYLELFQALTHSENNVPAAKAKATTPKAERIKAIRAAYAKAQENVAKDKTSENPHHIFITTHTTMSEEFPPVTENINIYFEQKEDKEKNTVNCPYFINYRSQCMYFDNYSEYLLNADGTDLIFSYLHNREEGEEYEWRYYYDENGKCIEAKTNGIEEGDGVAERQSFFNKLSVFKKMK